MEKQSEIKSNLIIRRQLLPYGFRAEYNFETPISAEQLKKLAELLVRKIIPEECRAHSEIVNIRGHDPVSGALLAHGSTSRSLCEELFYLAGDRPTKTEDQTETERLPFEISLTTKFVRFEGTHKIVHSITQFQEDQDAPRENLLGLTLDPEVSLRSLRLGLEFFQSSFLAFFGFSPAVTQTLQIECAGERMALRITHEGMRDRKTLPLSVRDTFLNTKLALKETFGFDVEADYTSRQ